MATKTTPDPETARDALWDLQDEQAYWAKHHSELLERYLDQFVAVRNGKVIANSPDPVRLVVIQEKRGIKPTDVWMRFNGSKPDRYLL